MRQFTIHAAKTNLSKLIEAALRGEEVVIAKGSKPVVRLVPVSRGSFTIGLLKDRLGTGPDFFEPMDEADLDAWEGEGVRVP
ncbi:prevent-host-death family protein [Azospirillum oryzae]|uniref:Antitoxin n=1 Tax=Azospirillum oryzae TaxID=286727 RepID=A0A1X7EYD9_9PROT|nr:type II toxin-antitoxin system prevent-host-death family antitoxin [Azospirillum oryzae]SMF41988.1 prevent-host-death family protein [Azospirillum oryzae]